MVKSRCCIVNMIIICRWGREVVGVVIRASAIVFRLNGRLSGTCKIIGAIYNSTVFYRYGRAILTKNRIPPEIIKGTVVNVSGNIYI